MQNKYAHLYSKISARRFVLFSKDVEHLRNTFSRLTQNSFRNRMFLLKRKQLINGILAEEFGKDPVEEYFDQVVEWDKMQKLVEGRT